MFRSWISYSVRNAQIFSHLTHKKARHISAISKASASSRSSVSTSNVTTNRLLLFAIVTNDHIICIYIHVRVQHPLILPFTIPLSRGRQPHPYLIMVQTHTAKVRSFAVAGRRRILPAAVGSLPKTVEWTGPTRTVLRLVLMEPDTPLSHFRNRPPHCWQRPAAAEEWSHPHLRRRLNSLERLEDLPFIFISALHNGQQSWVIPQPVSALPQIQRLMSSQYIRIDPIMLVHNVRRSWLAKAFV